MTTTSTENPRTEMTAVEIQQEYYETIGDTDWERYQEKDRPHLLQKIAVALCGPPTQEGNLTEKEGPLKLQGYDVRDEEITMKVFNKICEQAKYSHNGENILISILRVVCVIPAKSVPFFKSEPKDYWVNLHTKRGKTEVCLAIFHVFKVKKCTTLPFAVQPDAGDQVTSCRIFIDHDARVYNDWNSYLTKNKLPKSVMVVPENGEYKGTMPDLKLSQLPDGDFETPHVKLTVVPSPALGIGAKILNIADTTSTVVGVGAIVGAIGVVAVPAFAPVALGVTIAGAATSAYGIVRSSMELADRGKHEQSISLKNSDSRASWINLLVSTAGLSFSAATKLLAWAATTGTSVKVLINAFEFLKYTTIMSGAIGVTNSLVNMIHKYKKYRETPTKLELFQFTSSLLFLGIGVMSNQTAQEIVQDAQAKSINDVRDTLTSNAKRKMFDKVTAETRRLQGDYKGNMEVIKGLKEIKNKNEFFGKLSKMNKQFNENKLRISLTSEGNPLINNQHTVTISSLREMGQVGREKLLATYGPAKVTTKNVPTRIYPTPTTKVPEGQIAGSNSNFEIYIRPEEIYKIGQFLKSLTKLEMDDIDKLLSQITSEIHDAFLFLCAALISSFIPRDLGKISSLLGTNSKAEIISQLIKYLKSQFANSYDERERNSVTFEFLIKEFFTEGRIKPETIKTLRKNLIEWISTEKDKHNSDPGKYDAMFNNQTSNSGYLQVRAGQTIEVGHHKILINQDTIDTLTERLVKYSQNQCDLFLNFCYKVLSLLSNDVIYDLTILNPDDDMLMKVANFVFQWFETEFNENILDRAEDVKRYLENWLIFQDKRKHKHCTSCSGITYFV